MKQSTIVSLLRKEFGHHEVTVFSKAVKDQKGVLDTLNSVNWKSIFIEIKIDKDTIKPMQKKFMERFFVNSFCIHYFSNSNKFLLLQYLPEFGRVTTLHENINLSNICEFIKNRQ